MNPSTFVYEELPTECLSEYRLDRHLLGVESAEEEKATQTHLAQCSTCHAMLANMRADKEAWLAAPQPLPNAPFPIAQELREAPTMAANANKDTTPPALAAPSDMPKATKQAKPPRPWLIHFGTTLALAACCLLLLRLPNWRLTTPEIRDAGEYIGYKGKARPRLLVALRRGGKIRLAKAGEPFRHKDQIRLAYHWPHAPKSKRQPGLNRARRGYLYVFHRAISPHTSLTPLYPNKPGEDTKSLPIVRGRERDLPGSLEVDDATHQREEIWACFSYKAVSAKAVRAAVPPPSSTLSWKTTASGPCDFLANFHFTRAKP